MVLLIGPVLMLAASLAAFAAAPVTGLEAVLPPLEPWQGRSLEMEAPPDDPWADRCAAAAAWAPRTFFVMVP